MNENPPDYWVDIISNFTAYSNLDDLLSDPELQEPLEQQPLALADAAAPGSAASLLALLRGGGDIPEAARAGLIHFLEQHQTSRTPAAAQMGNVRLIQGGITIPNPDLGVESSFPHIVELNGALSAEDEACEWQQYKSKKTHIKVQLQDEQGAPPPHPCPHSSRLVYT